MCGLVGRGASLGTRKLWGFKILIPFPRHFLPCACYFMVRSQQFLTSCGCSTITDSSPLYLWAQINTFLYMLCWSWYLITVIKKVIWWYKASLRLEIHQVSYLFTSHRDMLVSPVTELPLLILPFFLHAFRRLSVGSSASVSGTDWAESPAICVLQNFFALMLKEEFIDLGFWQA